MDVILSQPRGFCAGVVRAVDLVTTALRRYGRPIYVLHEIVHNRHVVGDLEERGAVFVEDLGDVPEGAVVVFSAHGVGRQVERAAGERQLRVVDATCPLVSKVHQQVRRCDEAGVDVVLIGHAGHREVEGTRGQATRPVHLVSTRADVERLKVRNPNEVAYVTQTTLSVDDTRDVIEALTSRFPSHLRPRASKDICYATQNRQNAVGAQAGARRSRADPSWSSARMQQLQLQPPARRSANEHGRAEAHLIDDAERPQPGLVRAGIRQCRRDRRRV